MYGDSGTHVLLGRRLVVSRKPLGRLGAAAGAAAATSLHCHFDINETLVLSAALSSTQLEASLYGHKVDRVGGEYSDSREGCGAAPDRGLRLLQLDSSSPRPSSSPLLLLLHLLLHLLLLLLLLLLLFLISASD